MPGSKASYTTNDIDSAMPMHERPIAQRLPQLRRLDLNLLLVFDALMKSRSATAAAGILHKTQPAISRDLAKLRQRLRDPLLVLSKGRFIPTERALELHAVVRDSLERIDGAIGPQEFDPGQVEGVFSIATGAHVELLLAAPLLLRLRQQAPGLTVRFQSVHGDFDADDLDTERMDLAIGLFGEVAPRFHRETLFLDQRVCVVSASHPFAHRKRLSLHDLGTLEWFAFEKMHGRETAFDRALQPHRMTMAFSAYLSGFGVAPYVLASTNFATTMPLCVARLHQQHFPLAILDMPVPLREMQFSMVWNQRQHGSALHAWIRSELRSVLPR